MCLFALRSRLGAQPQRDVGRLHRLVYHSYEVVAQCIQIRLVSELGRQGFESLSGVVLLAVEAPVYEGLYATPQGIEESSNHEGGDDDG